MKKLFTLLFSISASQYCFAQCPTASFSLPDTGCAGATLPLINTSTGNGLSYQWDFCPNELKGAYTTNTHGTNGFNFNGLSDFKLIKANGNYYFMSFDTVAATQAFLRCDVGNNLYNQTPNANYYFLTPFNKADHFDFIEDNNIWYGFATYSPTNTLFLMTFGTGITSQPTTSAITGITNVNIPSSAKLVKHNGTFYGFITNKGDNSITCISFGNAMTNAPTQIYNYTVPGAVNLSDIDIALTCNPITGFATSENSGDIIKLNFGNDLSLVPSSATIGAFGSTGNKTLALGQEGNNYYLFFTDKVSNTLRQLSFPSDYSSVPVASTFTNFFNTIKDVQFLKDSSRVRLVAGDFIFNYFSEVIFLDSCGGNNFSDVQNPMYSYSGTGWRYLSLTVVDSLGFTDVMYDSIFLVPGPTANFSFSNNLCFNLNDSIAFSDLSSSPSGNITGWVWDFDDSSPVSTIQNPYHTFTTPGTYNVHLTITAGCNKDTIIPITIKETPSVGFTYVQQCAGIAIPFTDTTVLNSSTIQIWTWNFGDATAVSTLQNPSHNYLLGGTYNVQLLVQSVEGCVDSVILPVIVSSTPQIAFSVLNTCVGDTVLFQNQTTINNGGTINYTWDFGDGSPLTSVISPLHPYAAANTYNVSLVATSGLCSDTLVQPVTITTPPVPAFVFPSVNCQNNSVQFTDSSSGINISSWIWDFGDGDSAFVQNPVHVFAGSGPFTVSLTVSAGNNCTASVSQIIQIISSPNAAFISNDVCDGLPVSFTDISTLGPITNWIWSFGDGDSAFVQNNIHTYSSPGIYTTVLQVTNSLGCTDTASQQVIVHNIPVAGFEITQIMCSGSPVTFYDTSIVINDVIANWLWNFGDGGADSVQTPDHIYAAGGIQTINLTVTSFNGCSATIQQNILINQSPQFNFTAANFCSGDTTKFTYNVTGISSAFSWTWNFGDGGGAFTTNASHVYSSANVYPVSLLVIDSFSCASSYFDTIIINAKPHAAFITNGICEQAPVAFINSTTPSGIATSWLWNFGDLQTSTDSMPVHAYADSGNYSITLVAYASGGCNDTVTSILIIKPKPVLSFSQTPLSGALNTPVSFINLSAGASQYSWNFGDNTATSISTNPVHTYTDTGSFAVSLIGQSTFGCSDTIMHIYDVLLPYLDLVIQKVSYTIADNLLSLHALITNAGNVPAYNYVLEADIGNGNAIQETSFDTIFPSTQENYPLNTKFLISNDAFPMYACITLKKANGGLDAILTNNSKCTPLNSEFEMAEVSPNPVIGNLNVIYSLPADGEVKILLFDTRGRMVKELLSETEAKGLYNQRFDISSLSKGVYFVEVVFQNSAKHIRFLKM